MQKHIRESIAVKIEVERIDHLGLVAGKMKELGFVKMVDEMLGVDKQEGVSSGVCVLGMILNGLGFTDRPLSLTPQFFENKATGLLLAPGVTYDQLNRHKLGNVLDKISDFGCEKFFNSIAMQVCVLEKVNREAGHEDTSTFSLYGAYDSEFDGQEIQIVRGYSKDGHRDLKQVVNELLVSGDGSIPLMVKLWSGNTTDTKIFIERARSLAEEFKQSEIIQCLVADSKVYCKQNAPNLSKLAFITRIPSTVKLEHEVINEAIAEDVWQPLDDKNKFREFSVRNLEIDQRWIVVHSNASLNRAKLAMEKKLNYEKRELEQQLFHLQAKRFGCKDDAIAQLKQIEKQFPLFKLLNNEIIEHKHYDGRGRPTNDEFHFKYQLSASFETDENACNNWIDQHSCFVVGTNISATKRSAAEIVTLYKQQDKVEKSFAFLKSQRFFASSIFLKSTRRIEALVTIMVLALLAYAITQRTIRMQLVNRKLTVPNQINKPTNNPTLKWLFQCFEGVHLVHITIDGVIHSIVQGVNELRQQVIDLLGQETKNIYKIS